MLTAEGATTITNPHIVAELEFLDHAVNTCRVFLIEISNENEARLNKQKEQEEQEQRRAEKKNKKSAHQKSVKLHRKPKTKLPSLPSTQLETTTGTSKAASSARQEDDVRPAIDPDAPSVNRDAPVSLRKQLTIQANLTREIGNIEKRAKQWIDRANGSDMKSIVKKYMDLAIGAYDGMLKSLRDMQKEWESVAPRTALGEHRQMEAAKNWIKTKVTELEKARALQQAKREERDIEFHKRDDFMPANAVRKLAAAGQLREVVFVCKPKQDGEEYLFLIDAYFKPYRMHSDSKQMRTYSACLHGHGKTKDPLKAHTWHFKRKDREHEKSPWGDDYKGCADELAKYLYEYATGVNREPYKSLKPI
jgi:hypothetical protein